MCFDWCPFYFTKGEMAMNQTLRDQLKQWKNDRTVIEKEKKDHQKKPKRKAKSSTRDIMDLMGTNRQTLSRGKGGAYKQR